MLFTNSWRLLLKFAILAVLIFLFLNFVVPWLCLNVWLVVASLLLAALILGVKALSRCCGGSGDGSGSGSGSDE